MIYTRKTGKNINRHRHYGVNDDSRSDSGRDHEYDDDEEDNSVENEIKQTINYSKFKVDQLKQMCQEKELENYSKLKKWLHPNFV